jgi:hypothetical protein
MYETPAELAALQELLDTSATRAGPHLRRIFAPPSCSLSAGQLVRLFVGPKQVAVATVTRAGDPRVAPVDALLLHSKFHFGTHYSAARIRHLRACPRISLTYFERDELAILAHGGATLIEFGSPEFELVDLEFVAVYGGTPSSEEEGSVYVRVEPELVFTFAREPTAFPA